MNLLTFPQHILRPCLQALIFQAGRPQLLPLGLSRWEGNHELLVRPSDVRSSDWLQVVLGPGGFPTGWPSSQRTALSLGAGVRALVRLGRDEARGQAVGVVRVGTGLQPIDYFKWVGPGMHSQAFGARPARVPTDALPETLSRSIGALGEEEWRRLSGLRVGVVGLGRTGSSVAQFVERLGVRSLVLIDPDVVELHNLGEMHGLSLAAVGTAKVRAVASCLQTSAGAPGPEVRAVADSLTHLRGLHAAQACDVLFGCVDHDGARLALSALAALYHKPLIDVATGIYGRGSERLMGADVRLVLPGRCLRCLGGLRDEQGARRVLASAEAERAYYAGRRWQAEREGSLASLNQVAASVAMRAFEDFIAERIPESTWVRLLFTPSGRLEVSYPDVNPHGQRFPCAICDLIGRGDDGVGRWRELIDGLGVGGLLA
jgi:hypothetical protein